MGGGHAAKALSIRFDALRYATLGRQQQFDPGRHIRLSENTSISKNITSPAELSAAFLSQCQAVPTIK